jgi:hypothetical protein
MLNCSIAFSFKLIFWENYASAETLSNVIVSPIFTKGCVVGPQVRKFPEALYTVFPCVENLRGKSCVLSMLKYPTAYVENTIECRRNDDVAVYVTYYDAFSLLQTQILSAISLHDFRMKIPRHQCLLRKHTTPQYLSQIIFEHMK